MNSTLIFYIIVQFFALAFLYFGLKSKDKKQRRIFIFLSASILIFVIGLRSITTGADTQSYANVLYRYINDMLTVSDQNWISRGYFIIFFFIKYLFGYNYVAFNMIIGILTIYFMYKFILDNSKNPTFSLFLFFATCLFLQCLNQSRQMLAISIALYSFKYLKKDNFKKYFLFIVLAGLVHSSAFIMLPFYFIHKLKINVKMCSLYLFLVLFIVFGFDIIKGILLLTPYGETYIATNYMVESRMSSYMNLIVRVMLLIFAFFFKKSALKDDNDNHYLYHMAIWTLLTQIVTLKLYIFGRITTYFFAYYIISLPNLIGSIENKTNKKVYTFLVVLLFIIYFFVYYKFVSVSSGYDIYTFFWNS